MIVHELGLCVFFTQSWWHLRINRSHTISTKWILDFPIHSFLLVYTALQRQFHRFEYIMRGCVSKVEILLDRDRARFKAPLPMIVASPSRRLKFRYRSIDHVFSFTYAPLQIAPRCQHIHPG